jgi:hypothetical protein
MKYCIYDIVNEKYHTKYGKMFNYKHWHDELTSDVQLFDSYEDAFDHLNHCDMDDIVTMIKEVTDAEAVIMLL